MSLMLYPCMSMDLFVLRVCERLDAPSICFVCVFVCRKLSPHLGVWSWIKGVCSSYVVSLCDFTYYVFG